MDGEFHLDIDVAQLRALVHRILEHLEANTGGRVQLRVDNYWDLDRDQLYGPERPTPRYLNSLADDLDTLQRLMSKDERSYVTDLRPLSSILRAIGEFTSEDVAAKAG